MAYFAGIALISTATILLELALLRLFAVQQFYHFAFMAISLALLGAGASGSILSVWRRRFSSTSLCLIFSVTTVGAYLVLNYLPFDSFSIAWDRRQVAYLAAYFLVAAVPFLFAGLVVGGELMHSGDLGGGYIRAGSHQVYGANLIGSALGALATLPLLAIFDGVGAVIFAAILGAVSALLFSSVERQETGRSWRKWAGMMLVIGFIITGLLAILRPPGVLTQQLSPYKTLSVLLQTIDARHTLTDWDASTRVDVVESSAIHIMPGLSLLSPAIPPPQAGLMLDGDSLTPITNLDPDSEQARELARYTPNSLAYQLRPGARTLVIEAGTGMDVLFALAAGAAQVTAVEENQLLLEAVKEDYGEFTHNLYGDSRVNVVNQSGRVFARQQAKDEDFETGRYDVVIVALTEPHRPVTSGAFSLTENYIYTVDAFQDYLQLLGEDGLLVVTRWLQAPPSESGRTFGILIEALTELGLDPAEHIIAFRTLRTMTFVTSLERFTDDDLSTVRDFLEQRNYDPAYFTGVKPEELNQYGILEEPIYHNLLTRMLADPEAVYGSYRFDIEPPTDDRPFFYHYFKWRQTPEILAGLGYNWQPFGGSGYFVLVALLVVVVLASAVLIIAPLLFGRKARTPVDTGHAPHWRLRVLLYFACLGLAFLFVEIPLAQRFILILDQPVTALAIVLFAILLFSGLGSLSVRRLSLTRGMIALIVLIALFPIMLDPLSAFALSLPEWGRITLTVLAIAPLGFLMGLPFAGGLSVVESHDSSLVPWAWAINGSFSVISSVLAVMIALSWGFPAVFWLGAAAYAVALISFRQFWVKG
ncbi:MAG: hypothetical protein WA996_09355 [Candidatus Promineifilaceae bacterium]